MGDWTDEIDRNDPAVQRGAAMLYSGGCDSTLAACRLAEVFPKVHLITFTRFGFLQSDAPDVHFQRMQRRFPDVEFSHRLIPYGKFYEEVESFKRLRSMMKFGGMTSVPCGHCKVAMHWRASLWCKENDVRYCADGAVYGNEQFAEQNPRILMPELMRYYSELDLQLLHPVHEDGLDTEMGLFKLGITDSPRVKRTKKDKQIVCSQHILFAMYMRKYLNNHTFEEYEAVSKEYLGTKLDHVRDLTRAYLADPDNDRTVGRLLE